MTAKLWWAFDKDKGLVGAARTLRELLQICGVPPSKPLGVARQWHHYGPGSHELVWHFKGADDSESIFIEHCTRRALLKENPGGWAWAIEGVDVQAVLDHSGES
jgi:hypothetical protein